MKLAPAIEEFIKYKQALGSPYQRLLDIAARADAEEGIRQGLDDVANGRTRPAREVFDEIRRKQGTPPRRTGGSRRSRS